MPPTMCRCLRCKGYYSRVNEYSSTISCPDCSKKTLEEIEEKSRNHKLRCCQCSVFFKRPSKHSSSILCPKCMRKFTRGELEIKVISSLKGKQEYSRFDMIDFD